MKGLLKSITSIVCTMIFVMTLLCTTSANTVSANTVSAITAKKIVISVELFTVGGGFIVNPIEVTVSEGETLADAIVNVVSQSGYVCYYGGNTKESFYLAYIGSGTNTSNSYEGYTKSKTPQTPKKISFTTSIANEIVEKLNQDINIYYFDENDYSQNYKNYIGEFVYTNGSGFMYCVNGTYPSVSMSDYNLKDNDVVRVSYTLAYGQDIGGAVSVGGSAGISVNNYYETANKDDLIKSIAAINANVNKEKVLSNAKVKTAYDTAVSTMEKISAKKEEVIKATSDLNKAISDYENTTTVDNSNTNSPNDADDEKVNSQFTKNKQDNELNPTDTSNATNNHNEETNNKYTNSVHDNDKTIENTEKEENTNDTKVDYECTNGEKVGYECTNNNQSLNEDEKANNSSLNKTVIVIMGVLVLVVSIAIGLCLYIKRLKLNKTNEINKN